MAEETTEVEVVKGAPSDSSFISGRKAVVAKSGKGVEEESTTSHHW
jgi:hypothetical protein